MPFSRGSNDERRVGCSRPIRPPSDRTGYRYFRTIRAASTPNEVRRFDPETSRSSPVYSACHDPRLRRPPSGRRRALLRRADREPPRARPERDDPDPLLGQRRRADGLTPYQREALGFGSKTIWPVTEAFNRAHIARRLPGRDSSRAAVAAIDDRLEATQADADAAAKRFWQRSSWYRRANIHNESLAGQPLIDDLSTQGAVLTEELVEAAAAGDDGRAAGSRTSATRPSPRRRSSGSTCPTRSSAATRATTSCSASRATTTSRRSTCCAARSPGSSHSASTAARRRRPRGPPALPRRRHRAARRRAGAG